MWILSCVVLPTGLVLTLCVMSGVQILEKWAYQFCQFRLTFGESWRFRVVAVVVVICCLLFLLESQKLAHINTNASCMVGGISKVSGGNFFLGLLNLSSKKREVADNRNAFHTSPVNSAMTSFECKAYRWRHERNWWISMVNLIVWISLWRTSAVVHDLLSKLSEATEKNVKPPPPESPSRRKTTRTSESVKRSEDEEGIELTTNRQTADQTIRKTNVGQTAKQSLGSD